MKIVIGILALLLTIACLVIGVVGIKKKKYPLGVIMLLNVITNFITCVHAFSGTLF
jgi:hypothetical protein